MSVRILGIKIAETTLHRAVLWVHELAERKFKSYICFAPASTLVYCCENVQYKTVIEGAKVVFPDGMSVVLAGKIKGAQRMDRICGIDFMDLFCDISSRPNLERLNPNGLRHFFFGSHAHEIAFEMKKKYPLLNIAGYIEPSYRSNSQIEKLDIIEEINLNNPDILWVALGSPKQDFWMANHRELLDVPAMLGVGAAFNYLTGLKKRAPVWMRKSGLEWLYRLIKEPRRLWKRYVIGNFKFIYYLITRG